MDWIRYTSVERLADKHQVAVVMPSVDLGFYTDMYQGEAYFTYVTQELPEYLKKVFPLSGERRNTYVAGLSMGGYGALKAALTYPERYSAAASMSGVLDVADLMRNIQLTNQIQLTEVLKWCYKDSSGADSCTNSLVRLMERAQREKQQLPRIFQCIGKEDFLYSINQKFRKESSGLGVDITYQEGPGLHDWEYWESKLSTVFEWLMGNR